MATYAEVSASGKEAVPTDGTEAVEERFRPVVGLSRVRRPNTVILHTQGVETNEVHLLNEIADIVGVDQVKDGKWFAKSYLRSFTVVSGRRKKKYKT